MKFTQKNSPTKGTEVKGEGKSKSTKLGRNSLVQRDSGEGYCLSRIGTSQYSNSLGQGEVIGQL